MSEDTVEVAVVDENAGTATQDAIAVDPAEPSIEADAEAIETLVEDVVAEA